MAASKASESESSAPAEASASPEKLRYAVKTSLSLTLAYLLPMALGWPQPQTAATTVMLIAATGMVSESLQKGIMRILGTVAGAIIGLSLIALFPQDRMLYLLAVSCAVSIAIYLYNAFQGDSTVFMLTAVVTLMVFNGGDAQGAFTYGIDRAHMTAFGVIIYTLVSSMLWPVKLANNTRGQAASLNRKYRQAFELLVKRNTNADADPTELLSDLLAEGTAFESHFAAVKNHTDGITDYLPEWNAVAAANKEMENILLPALQQGANRTVDYHLYVENYDALLDRIQSLFVAIDAAWQGQDHETDTIALSADFNREALRQGSHLETSAVVSRVEILQQLQAILLEVLAAQDSLLFDKGHFVGRLRSPQKPAFIWLDLENFKTALRAFITFWIATAIWITTNPPGGFMFVTLCTVLIPLTSYTPVTPKLLFILFTLGFLFALPAYVFLLPQMTHWLELALFLFGYAFIGFYVFKGPVSIFFLLGLFTLGVQNEMQYAFNGILLTITMFYLVCAMQIISTQFPFTSKPERLYASLRRRFFLHCARLLRLSAQPTTPGNRIALLLLGSGAPLLAKMNAWGAKIDPARLGEEGADKIAALNRSCELLYGALQVMARRRTQLHNNTLIMRVRDNSTGTALADLCDALARLKSAPVVDSLQDTASRLEARLDEMLGDNYLEEYEPGELAQFYVYLNLNASVLNNIVSCMSIQQELDWQSLGETRF